MPDMEPRTSIPVTNGWRFWLRTGWWSFTHPFSRAEDNPGVQATLDALIRDVRRLERVRIADELREIATCAAFRTSKQQAAAELADFIEEGENA